MLTTTTPKYWFRAKRYGWGWGLPLTWQGWVVLGTWFASLVPAMFLFRERPMTYVAFVLVGILALIGICWLKGEPPRWRWGDPR